MEGFYHPRDTEKMWLKTILPPRINENNLDEIQALDIFKSNT